VRGVYGEPSINSKARNDGGLAQAGQSGIIASAHINGSEMVRRGWKMAGERNDQCCSKCSRGWQGGDRTLAVGLLNTMPISSSSGIVAGEVRDVGSH